MDPQQAQQARTIGRRVKQVREARGKSLVVIAGLAGMSKSKLDRIELGESALDKLSDIVALADALEIAPGDLVRLPLPAPAIGHTDATIEAVGQTLDEIEDGEPNGLVLPVAVLHKQVLRLQNLRRTGRFAEVATDLPGLIRNLHTTLNTGVDHAEVLDLAVHLHVHVTVYWLMHAGAHTHLLRRVAYMAQRLARERDEVTTLAMTGFAVADVLLAGGALQRSRAKLDSIALPPTAVATAGLVAFTMMLHAATAVLDSRAGDAAAPMDLATELAERFGTTGEVDSYGFMYGPALAGTTRMWLALEADDPDQAVSVARGVDPGQHPFPAQQASYWMYFGRALSKLPSRGDDAVRALRTAERIFPTRVLRHQGVREVLGELLAGRSVRTMGLELRGMAYRAGVLTQQTPA